ncbi:MAG: DUF1573 domain-containing protein [Bacteroidia bacterium]|nr:DUF1573 domain-containing protein [Bacteroidia bacterium]
MKLLSLTVLTLFSGLWVHAQKEQDSLYPVFKLVASKHYTHHVGKYEFDTLTSGEVGEFEVAYTNTGNAPLVLLNVKTSCGCMVASWPREPVLPGDTALIKVRLSTHGRFGMNHKSMTIVHNASTSPEIVVFAGYIRRGKE